MNFQQFQATRKRVDDSSEYTFQDDDKDRPAFIYCDGLHIHINDAKSQYELLIERSEYWATELAGLELILFDFAKDEGFCK